MLLSMIFIHELLLCMIFCYLFVFTMYLSLSSMYIGWMPPTLELCGMKNRLAMHSIIEKIMTCSKVNKTASMRLISCLYIYIYVRHAMDYYYSIHYYSYYYYGNS